MVPVAEAAAVALEAGGGGGLAGGGGRMQISTQGRGMEAADISKIIYLGPNETKKIGIVLDAQPRAMMINTLFAKNIPGEITLPIDKIIKSKDVIRNSQVKKSFIISASSDSTEIIIDNEDPGFIISKQNTVNSLKNSLEFKTKTEALSAN